ncbi:hypothetical protein ACTQ33_06125 [Candidatus Avoscillospira sp. LCP25S3_F1]|uniref:hypothetical protein n=1 Tax=Candidatus Avoscillospira sp. LCP25S3_F1 TaxID=3438825 RepID=UPI003F8F4C38
MIQDIRKTKDRYMGQAEARRLVELLIAKSDYDTFILLDSNEEIQASVSLEGFVVYLNVIMQYSEMQKKKYRGYFANNGTAEVKKHECAISKLRGNLYE